MFEISVKAQEKINEFLKTREENPSIRILVAGGWGGPSLGMALDEPRETDKVFENDGVTYLIDQDLFEKVKPINVDYVVQHGMGRLKIDSSLPAGEGGCSGCSGSC